MTRARRRRGGFTLIETAVTIVVMGAVAALGYGGFSMLIDRRARLRAAMVETERAAATRAMLEAWFARSLLEGPMGTNLPRSTDAGGASKDMLSFITRAPTRSRAWATVMIMFIDDNPSTPERGLTVRYLGYNGDGVSWLRFSNMEPAQTQDARLRKQFMMPSAWQLDDRVVGLRVEYLDRRTHQWQRARVGALIVPIAARVTLEGTPSAPLPPLLQVPFLITRQDRWPQP